MKRAAFAGACALILVVAVAGCVGPADDAQSETRDVQAAIVVYNDALVRAFAAQDMNALSAVATENQAYTEFYLMAALGEGGVRMHATLQSIDFSDVTFPADGEASVTTTEVWDYDHVSLDTSETVRTERGVVYHLRYDLVRFEDRWLVDAVTSLDEEPASEDATGGEVTAP